MEIERKYLIPALPDGYETCPCRQIEQGYLNTAPVVRVRREGDQYYLTYKGKGLMCREECNLPLDEASYRHLLQKTDGIILTKTRYLLPLAGDSDLTIELDIFSGHYDGLVMAEVEFPSEAAAEAFTPPSWFGEEVTFLGKYHNSYLSQHPQHSQ